MDTLISSSPYLTENRIHDIGMLNTTIYKFLLTVFLGGSMAVTGQWNIGGYALPDFSITEKLGIGSPNPLVSAQQQGTTSGLVGFGGEAFTTPDTSSNPSNTANLSPLFSQQGQVQGTSTQNTSGSPSSPNNSGLDPHINPSTGLWDDNYFQSQQKTDTGALFNQINSGWDSYIGQLNSMLNTDLPNQLASQQGLARQSFDTSVNEAGNQKASSERQLGEQQKSSLKDLGSNIKNLFQAGNTYLGNRGAGDSSAANQYAYALTQMGSKARANVMAQVQARSQQIGDIYNTEKNRLSSELTSRMSQLTDWFSNAQSQLRQQLGTAGLNKSRDIQALSQNLYNQALQAKQQIESEARAQQSALTQWAMNNSKSVAELAAKFQQIGANNQPFQGMGNPLTTQQQTTTPSLFGGAMFGKPDENKI